jgi:glycerol kinase
MLSAAEHWDGFLQSKNRLITTLAASADRKLEYALEGSIFIGGAVVQWLRDNLKLIQLVGGG